MHVTPRIQAVGKWIYVSVLFHANLPFASSFFNHINAIAYLPCTLSLSLSVCFFNFRHGFDQRSFQHFGTHLHPHRIPLLLSGLPTFRLSPKCVAFLLQRRRGRKGGRHRRSFFWYRRGSYSFISSIIICMSFIIYNMFTSWLALGIRVWKEGCISGYWGKERECFEASRRDCLYAWLSSCYPPTNRYLPS